MGMVWAARNEATDREVALKLIPRGNGFTEELRTRLLREARACGRIAHKNVVEILDAGEAEDGAPFLVMPLLEGETLAARLAREGPLPVEQVVRVAVAMARGLAAAHAAGIVHRDLKPGNVFLQRDPDGGEPVVKVLDFGISKILTSEDATATVTGSTLGSPAYMSPEQARGDKGIDARTDLWSLGIVLFEMITGTRPFEGETPYLVVANILSARVPRLVERVPGVPLELDRLVARCLERDVAKRITSAAELIAAMSGSAREALASVPFAAPPAAPPGAPEVSATSTTPLMGTSMPSHAVAAPVSSRNKLVAGAAVVSLLAIVGAGFVALTRAPATPAAAPPPSAVTPAPSTTPSSTASQASTSVAPATASASPTRAPTAPRNAAPPQRVLLPVPATTRKPSGARLPADPG